MTIKMPIRWRLVGLSTLGLFLILVLFHVFVYYLFMGWTMKTEESILKSKLLSLQKVYEQEQALEPHNLRWLNSLIEDGQAIRIIKNGNVIAIVNKGIPSHLFLPEQIKMDQPEMQTWPKQDVLILAIPLNKDISTRMELYTDYSATSKYVNSMLSILIGASFVLLIVVIIGGYMMSSIAFRPITQITKEVQEYNPAERSQRLEVPDTGDEIATLSQVFNSLLDRMYDLIQQQNRFVSDASHELRTPIAVIRGYLDLLRRWGLTRPEVAQEAMQTMDQELRRVENMTERLLRIARFEMEETIGDETPFSIKQLVEERVRRWQQVIQDISIHYTLPETDILFFGLKGDWEELLDILLDNAGKYTDSGGSIEVKVMVMNTELSISVQDTGQGIPPADLPHVFKRFYRVARPRTAKQSGSGLGLSIAKQIVEKYKGRVEIKSQLGKGTIVKAIFPISNQLLI